VKQALPIPRLLPPLLAAGLLASALPAAEFLPHGDGGFARLTDAEAGTATSFAASLVPPDGDFDEAAAPRLLLPLRREGGWLLYLAGWPENGFGDFDLLLRCGPERTAPPVRLPRAVRREPREMDVALLLDDSRSMRSTDPRRLRVAATRLFARMAAARGDVRTLTIVAFNHRPRLLLPPSPPGNAAAIEEALGRLEAAGATDLDAAFALAARQLAALPPSRKIGIVLSDGRDEPGDYTFGHRLFSARRWPVHTIGLSDAIDAQTLELIAASTGGRFHRAASTEELAGIFRAIAAALHPGVTVGEWTLEPEQKTAFPVDDTLRLLSLALVARTEQPAACALRSPDSRARALSTLEAADAFADIFAPPVGTWQARGAGAPALLAVTADSALDVIPFPLPPAAFAGKPLPVAAFVRQDGRLLTNVVIAVGVRPAADLVLRDDGLSADGAPGDGIFGGYLDPEAVASGNRQICHVARGTTFAGNAFQRLAGQTLPPCSAAGESLLAGSHLLPPAVFGGHEASAGGPVVRAPASAPPAAPSPPLPSPVVPGETAVSAGSPFRDSAFAASVPAAPAAGEIIAADNGLPHPAPSPPWRRWVPGLDLLHLLLLAVALLLLLWLVARLPARLDARAPRMAKYFALSVLLHALLAMLVVDLLVQTHAVDLERLSPALALTVQAIEESTGLALTPPPPAVPLRDRESALQVERSLARREGKESFPAAQATPETTPTARLRPGEPPAAAPVTPRSLLPAEPRLKRLELKPDPPAEQIEPATRRQTAPAADREEAQPLAVRLTAMTTDDPDPPAPAMNTAEEQPNPVSLAESRGLPGHQPTAARMPDSIATPELPSPPAEAAAEQGAAPLPPKARKDAGKTERAAPAEVARAAAASPPAQTSAATAPLAAARPAAGDAPAAAAAVRAPAAAASPAGGAPAPAPTRVATGTRTPELPRVPEPVGELPAMPQSRSSPPRAEVSTSVMPLAPAQTAVPPAMIATVDEGPRVAAPGRPGSPDYGTAASFASTPVAVVHRAPVARLPAPAPVAAGLARARIPSVRRTPPDVAEPPPGVPLPRAVPATGHGREKDRPAGAGATPGPSRAAAPEPAADIPAEARPAKDDQPRPMAAPTLEPPPTPLPSLPRSAEDGHLTFRSGKGPAGRRRFTIGLAQYGGDWDWARHAMTFLGHQLRERTRLVLDAEDRVVTLDSPHLHRLPFVYMTGHRDFRFSDAEIANLRAYLHGGGYLWADDSTHFQDETFDRAFRRELARLLPEAPLERLGMDFPAFRTGYDLTRGYMGYAIPPGDKYRLDYIEGARIGDRVAVIYTRNDYGDGLNIDEHTHPLHVSLTDLSPAEMQEGAVRMGINLTLYFLTGGQSGGAAELAPLADTLGRTAEPAPPRAPAGTERPLTGFDQLPSWTREEWGDHGTLTAGAAGGLECAFTTGPQGKCAWSWTPPQALELTSADVVVLDVASGLRCGARLALGFTVGDRYFETRPAFIKPGANVALFPCGERTFKSAAGGWRYTEGLPSPAAVERLTLLVYSPAAGEMRLQNPRVVRPAPQR
jgi:Mg-chelatase subunit ChlD